MESSRITVLTCVYNYGRYLSKTVNSVLAQTLRPSCLCLVDDCSNDNSWEIIGEYAEQNQREEHEVPTPGGNIQIKLGNINGVDILGVRLPQNSGPSVARNIGIQFCEPSTDFFAILDGDDQMLPNKLEECLKPFEDERVGLVYANYYNINEDTGVKVLEVKEPYSIDRLQQECIVHSGFVVRKGSLDMVKENGVVYDPLLRTCEDWDLEIRLSNACMFCHIPEALTDVLVHSNNSTNSVSRENWERNWQRIRQKHFGG